MNLLIAENDFALVGVLNVSKPKAIPWSLRVTRSNPCPRCEDREYHAAIIDLDLLSTEGLANLGSRQPCASGRARPRSRLRRG